MILKFCRLEWHPIAIYTKLSLHHRDPYDRLLIAQAMTEKVSIIGADVTFDSYSVNRIW